MPAFIDVLIDIATEYWLALPFSLLGLLVGTLWGRWRAWRQWSRREFLHRLNISLNTIQDGYLRIRTVLEKDLLEVMLNRVAVDEVLVAASKATEKDPMLPLPEEDAWFLLNGVLNEVSELFAVGLVKKDLSIDAASARYLLCLTYEVAGAVRTHKVRAMLIRRETLENLPEEMPALESPTHIDRWHTLQRMARAWQETPYLFLEVEIAV